MEWVAIVRWRLAMKCRSLLRGVQFIGTRSSNILAAVSLVSLALASALLLLPGSSTYAESSGSDWSPPVLLFQSRANVRQPILLTDQARNVYAFWWVYLFPEGSPEYNTQLIYYSRQSPAGWSKPVDIVASTRAFPSSVALDQNNELHLLWHGISSRLYYTRATVDEAFSARRWTNPVSVAETFESAHITSDSAGRLHRAYAALGSRGLYHQVSEDEGITWSFPVKVANTSSPKSAVNGVRLAIGEDGTLHAVWTEWQLPTGWPPVGVFYARSSNGGLSWSVPVELAGRGYDQINVVAGPKGRVHVAWNGMAGVGGRYHRWSSDDGITWSPTDTVTKEGFTEGYPQLAVDSAGVLHLVTSHDSRLVYGSWQPTEGWSGLTDVPTLPDAEAPPEGQTADTGPRHIEQPGMAIGAGNQLHVLFWDERETQGLNYLWYTTKRVPAPAVAPVPVRSAAPAPTAKSTALPAPSPSSTAVQEENEAPAAEEVPDVPASPHAAIFMGLWPAAVLVGGLVFLKTLRLGGA